MALHLHSLRLFVQGLSHSPSARELQAVYSHVAELSPSFASLKGGFVPAPVLRLHGHGPAFFLSHLSFGNPTLAARILRELRQVASVDHKGLPSLPHPRELGYLGHASFSHFLDANWAIWAMLLLACPDPLSRRDLGCLGHVGCGREQCRLHSSRDRLGLGLAASGATSATLPTQS